MEKAATPGAEFIAFIKDFLREGGIPHSGPQCLPLAGDGSRRAFWRILTDQGGRTFVAVENFPVDAFSGRENRAYLMIGRHLFEKGLPSRRSTARIWERDGLSWRIWGTSLFRMP